MKKVAVLIVGIIYSTLLMGQIEFEPGYIITESGEKIDCLIKNVDWKNSPSSFQYKLSENGSKLQGSIHDIKEFGSEGIYKYIRANVLIDKASDELEDVSDIKDRPLSDDTLFLKVLVEGDASLYQWTYINSERYFYSSNGSEIGALIYNLYLRTNANLAASDDKQLAENIKFRRQLWNNLKCEGIKMSRIEGLDYNKKSLAELFIEYNKCTGSTYKDFINKEKRGGFQLHLRPRISQSSVNIRSINNDRLDADFPNKIEFGLGLDAELFLPFNNNKWAVTIEPSIRSLKHNVTEENDLIFGGVVNSTINYRSLEFPLGVRHYFFLENDTKLFLTALILLDVNLNSDLVQTRSGETVLSQVDLKSRPNFGIGFGISPMERINVELRYHTSRDILGSSLSRFGTYKSISLIAGIRII